MQIVIILKMLTTNSAVYCWNKLLTTYFLNPIIIRSFILQRKSIIELWYKKWHTSLLIYLQSNFVKRTCETEHSLLLENVLCNHTQKRTLPWLIMNQNKIMYDLIFKNITNYRKIAVQSLIIQYTGSSRYKHSAALKAGFTLTTKTLQIESSH